MIICGNSLDELKKLEANSIDSVVTDPPYGLSFMGKKWDYDVPQVELWTEVLRVLKPGGYLLSFAGTRTQHRMAVNIEDAGFEIRDMIAWVYGSGFPKSHNIGKAVDKIQGNEREDLGEYDPRSTQDGAIRKDRAIGGQQVAPSKTAKLRATKGTSPYEGWGTALKPALEPITVARKPLGTPEFDVVKAVEHEMAKNGIMEVIWTNAKPVGKTKQTRDVGSVRRKTMHSIDNATENESESHTESGEITTKTGLKSQPENTQVKSGKKSLKPTEVTVSAVENQSLHSSPLTTSTEEAPNTVKEPRRYITNSDERGFLLDTELFAGTVIGDIEWASVHIRRNSDGSYIWNDKLPKHIKARTLTVANNVLEWGTGGINIDGSRVGAGGGTNCNNRIDGECRGHDNNNSLGGGTMRHGEDTQPQGRFPANLIHDGSDEVNELLNDSARFFYCAKAGKKERNKGLEGFEKTRHADRNIDNGVGGDNPRNRTNTSKLNHHPTVKPVKLMQYLVKLVTPKDGTVLDPFNGSGTTGIACKLEGFEYIGIDLDPEYCKISEARIKAWKRDNKLL